MGFLKSLFGPPTSFAQDEPSVHHAAAAGRRQQANWVFPIVVTILFTTILIFCQFDPSWFFLSLPIRIILFDYMVFFVSWFDAFYNARKWGNKWECVEELSITPIKVSSIGEVIFAPMVTIWYRCFLFIAFVDILFVTWRFIEGFASQMSPFYIIVYPIWIFVLLLLPRFHSESLRIAYWLFAKTALPGVNFVSHSINVAIRMFFTVAALTIVGAAVTGMIMLMIWAMFEAIRVMGSYSLTTGDFRQPFDMLWLPGAILGLIFVNMLKRATSGMLSREFAKRLVMSMWWGISDSNHPKEYPVSYRIAAAALVSNLSVGVKTYTTSSFVVQKDPILENKNPTQSQ